MIREMTLKDYSEVKNIYLPIYYFHAQNNPNYFSQNDPMPYYLYLALFQSPNILKFVYEENQEVLGFVIASIKYQLHETIIILENIGIKEGYKRIGIGTKLYNHLVTIAQIENIETIELSVWSFNTNAINFYNSLTPRPKTLILERKISS